jgi:thiamine-phosphate pyrophosphorylase
MEQQDQTLRGLYIVTPDWDDTARLLAVTEQALAGRRSDRAVPA